MRYLFFILFIFTNYTSVYALDQDIQPCSSLTAPAKPLFAPAHKFAPAYTMDESMLYFNPFFKIDWKAIAPGWITRIDPNNLRQEDVNLLKENMYYESSSALTYEAPLDCTTKIGIYLLISDTGINPVKLSVLEGRTKFTITTSGDKIIGRPEYGGLIAFLPPSDKANKGGFVMLTDGKLDDVKSRTISLDPEFSATEEGGKVTYTYVKSGEELQFTKNWYAEYDHPLEILTMYKFQMHANDYIYVRWAANENYCSFNATLFGTQKSFGYQLLQEISSVHNDCGGWL